MLAIQKIKKKYFAVPPLDLDLLIAHALPRPREFLYTHPKYRLSLIAYLKFRYYLSQYRRGYSVAAITHHKEFYGLDFYVNKHVLTPRPETEMMVKSAVEEIRNFPDPEGRGFRLRWEKLEMGERVVLIDVGTGSGCIPIAVAQHVICHPERSEGSKRTNRSDSSIPQNDNVRFFATDISRSALRVARRNARTHNVSITFLHGNLLEPIISQFPNFQFPISNLIITANLPYLTQEQFDSEPSIQKEPRLALVANKQGLALYEELLHQIKSLLLLTPYSLLLFLEIDPSQSSAITELVKHILPTASVEIQKDLSGRDRLVVIRSDS